MKLNLEQRLPTAGACPGTRTKRSSYQDAKTGYQILAKRGPDSRFVVEANTKSRWPKLSRSRIVKLMDRGHIRLGLKSNNSAYFFIGSYTNNSRSCEFLLKSEARSSYWPKLGWHITKTSNVKLCQATTFYGVLCVFIRLESFSKFCPFKFGLV